MKRHIGRLVNTDQRVVVVYMQIAGREDHALVIPSDNLPARWEQLVQSLVESGEGQQEVDFANILGRRMMPDSTESIMQALHSNGLLQAVPIKNVIMLPFPNQPYPLRDVLKAMGKFLPDDALTQDAAPAPQADKYNPHTTNQKADVSAADVGIAQSLLIEADMLVDSANAKREQAYGYAPHLRPKTARAASAVVAAEAPKTKAKPKSRATAKRATPTRAKKTVA